MARKTKIEKINSLEEQIKELEQKKKEMLELLYIDIGRYVVTEWNSNDDKELKTLIDHFKEEAIKIINENHSINMDSEEFSNEGQRTG
ncbi:hypothetical protein [Cytobacillus oceanisediminis]|uniref:hypothetical protein n=1 Tax=Cytobacillus oceanisediminis TaxID=665099 RepID=UPI00203A59BF|nr:hypothetical protein [Cytobacillus oceanisediminis]MCM3405526.1 hypothetical protein [Cytobacillus oceanisediminis]